ncbi:MULTISPECIES: hypothetical protein [Streptomyces]|uniref:hypothetical protein n=1 Tax=Streptomyces TaxID=1883 RepID=UPI000F55356C|nr:MULTISPECIES: hypothetical protein [Streptomyces]RPK70664.1 hypothetical protein EES45_35445 [Streptomyces sp. ADI97-07]WRY79938.1 hypothetical protein OG388_01125 [Streptomyces clavifer]WRY86379.1 hypothetical protein OG388_36865 [Streptomyces clavifer]WUC32433.1 hypothetical protein OG927_34305 [Streptomyces clavifer]
MVSLGLAATALVGCGSPDTGDPPRPPGAAKVDSTQRMVRLLEAALPSGTVSEQRGQGTEKSPASPPSAALSFEKDGRRSEVDVTLYRWAAPIPQFTLRCPDTAYSPYSQCTESKLSGGAVLVLDQSPENNSDPSGAVVFTARLTYKDGKQVVVRQSGVRPAGAAASVGAPSPLTRKHLSTIAASDGWKAVLSRMPEPPAEPRTSADAMTGTQMAATIASLAPSNLHVSEQGSSDGFGHAVVNDGHGKSLVGVNVQQWDRDDPRMREVFGTAETLADGTRVRVDKSPSPYGGSGAVVWTVDTFHTDGFRVVVQALNARAFKLPASRDKPALGIPQLRDMALSGAWRRTDG